jgi:hypothetical protein
MASSSGSGSAGDAVGKNGRIKTPTIGECRKSCTKQGTREAIRILFRGLQRVQAHLVLLQAPVA